MKHVLQKKIISIIVIYIMDTIHYLLTKAIANTLRAAVFNKSHCY